jgi:hypothetical protein
LVAVGRRLRGKADFRCTQNTFRSPASSCVASRRVGEVFGEWTLIPWLSEREILAAL